jgi:hypothetical protein
MLYYLLAQAVAIEKPLLSLECLAKVHQKSAILRKASQPTLSPLLSNLLFPLMNLEVKTCDASRLQPWKSARSVSPLYSEAK